MNALENTTMATATTTEIQARISLAGSKAFTSVYPAPHRLVPSLCESTSPRWSRKYATALSSTNAATSAVRWARAPVVIRSPAPCSRTPPNR